MWYKYANIETNHRAASANSPPLPSECEPSLASPSFTPLNSSSTSPSIAACRLPPRQAPSCPLSRAAHAITVLLLCMCSSPFSIRRPSTPPSYGCTWPPHLIGEAIHPTMLLLSLVVQHARQPIKPQHPALSTTIPSLFCLLPCRWRSRRHPPPINLPPPRREHSLLYVMTPWPSSFPFRALTLSISPPLTLSVYIDIDRES